MAALVGRAFNSDRRHRALTIAVVVSILLHIALLLVLPMLRDAQQRPNEVRERIFARLVEPSAKPAPVAAPQAGTLEQRKSVAAPVPSPATSPVTSEAKQPVDKPAPPQPIRRQIQPATRPAHQPSFAAEPAQPASAVSDAPDTGTLAQYRLAVISAAKRYKRYPDLALENKWQGKVEVRLSIGADGSISGLVVRATTGHSLLDQHALEMIEHAKAVAQIPPALRGRQFAVDIPVEFTLRDAGA